MTEIRMITANDIPALKQVLHSIELFPAEMLDSMMNNYLLNPESDEIWFTAVLDNQPVAIGFCAPEKLTQGTYNLYAIGVRSDKQAMGIGSQMMEFIENHLRNSGHRILIVETSGADNFKLTRMFYEKLHYIREAVIRAFWRNGEDKIIYWKKLS